MPSEPAEQVHIVYTSEFKRNLRALAKNLMHFAFDNVKHTPIGYLPLD